MSLAVSLEQFWSCDQLKRILAKTFHSSEVLPHIKYRSALLNCTGQILPTNTGQLVFTNPMDKAKTISISQHDILI